MQVSTKITLKYIEVYHKYLTIHLTVHFNQISKTEEVSNYKKI